MTSVTRYDMGTDDKVPVTQEDWDKLSEMSDIAGIQRHIIQKVLQLDKKRALHIMNYINDQYGLKLIAPSVGDLLK